MQKKLVYLDTSVIGGCFDDGFSEESSKLMEKTKKNFDVMEWLRGVRDEDYRRWGHLPTDEYIRKISEEGEKSELAQKLREKAAKRKKH